MEKIITLYRGEKCYYATNQDADVVTSLCKGNCFSARGTKYSVFADIVRNLPILVRHGYRVKICDAE